MARVQYEAVFASELMEPILGKVMAASWANILVDNPHTDISSITESLPHRHLDVDADLPKLGHQVQFEAKSELKRWAQNGEIVLLLRWSVMGAKDFRLAFRKNETGRWVHQIAPSFAKEVEIAKGWLTIAHQNSISSKISRMTQELRAQVEWDF